MRDSIIYSAIRSLFSAFCTVLGICLGFIALFMIIGSFSGNTDDYKFKKETTEEILPNAKGIRTSVGSEAPVILQINIDEPIGTESLNANNVRQILTESREGNFKNDRIKGIFLYIDSPGGVVSDVDIIFNAILDYKKKYNIPVYAYVDGICASGSLYIALAADKILSSNISLIGSVGVISPPFMNFSKMMDKVGIESLTISSGKGKDALNPFRPWVENEDKNYRDINAYYYNFFVDLVAAHRPLMNKEKLINEYGAHVFPAPIAQEYGYIDASNSTLQEALAELVAKAGIEDDRYQVIRLQDRHWWKNLFSSQATAIFSGKIQHEIALSPEMKLLFKNQPLYLYHP